MPWASIYHERDFRIRQFVAQMRSHMLFGMARQQAVALTVQFARASPEVPTLAADY